MSVNTRATVETLTTTKQMRFHRLQFTPDMLPADIIGTMIYNPRDANFHTKEGPIFSNFIPELVPDCKG